MSAAGNGGIGRPNGQPVPPDAGGGAGASRTAAGGRSELLIALLGTLVGAGLLLLSAGRPWAHAAITQPPLPLRRLAVSGTQLGGVVVALGLLALAGAAVIIAVRGLVRRALGVLLVMTGVVAVLCLGLASPSQVRKADVVRAGVTTGSGVSVRGRTAWPAAYALGGVLVAAAGAWTAARGARWPGLGSRYDAPGTPKRTRADDPWSVLDRGEDPTL